MHWPAFIRSRCSICWEVRRVRYLRTVLLAMTGRNNRERLRKTGYVAASEVSKRRSAIPLWPEISAQLLCATPTAHWLEYADWWNPILKDPLHVKNGTVCLDGVIGSGVEWNEEAVARYSV